MAVGKYWQKYANKIAIIPNANAINLVTFDAVFSLISVPFKFL